MTQRTDDLVTALRAALEPRYDVLFSPEGIIGDPDLQDVALHLVDHLDDAGWDIIRKGQGGGGSYWWYPVYPTQPWLYRPYITYSGGSISTMGGGGGGAGPT